MPPLAFFAAGGGPVQAVLRLHRLAVEHAQLLVGVGHQRGELVDVQAGLDDDLLPDRVDALVASLVVAMKLTRDVSRFAKFWTAVS
jgi:hypothetical protein